MLWGSGCRGEKLLPIDTRQDAGFLHKKGLPRQNCNGGEGRIYGNSDLLLFHPPAADKADAEEQRAHGPIQEYAVLDAGGDADFQDALDEVEVGLQVGEVVDASVMVSSLGAWIQTHP